jgi:hypothetical protein
MSFIRNEPSLRMEDYPKELASGFSSLFRTLTPYFSSITSSINGSIDFVDNIAAVTKSYDMTNVQFPINIQWPFAGNPPKDLRVMKASAANVATILIPAWSFDVSTNIIAITKILEAPGMALPVVGVRYQFSVRATI